MNNDLHLGKLEVVNVLLILIISISFLLLPWFKISEYFSITALNGVFKFYNVLNNFEFVKAINFINFIFSIYLISLYLILLFNFLSSFYLIHTHNVKQFNFYCRIGFIIDLIICAISIVLKYSISSEITSEINSNGFGLSGYLSSYVESIFTFGSGFYVILICSAIGILAPYFFKTSSNTNNSIHIGSSVNNQENVEVKRVDKLDRNQTISYRNNPISNENNRTPKIVLRGEKDIPIYNLPAVIGRNREQVNVFISDPSVSRVHCKVEESDNEFFVIDLGSSYGTGINGENLNKNQGKVITNNDVLKLGDIEFRVSINDSVNRPSYLNKTISKNRFINQTTQNSLDEDYIPKRADSPKLYTEDISVVHNNLAENSSSHNEELEQNTILILKSDGQNKQYLINKTPYVIGSDALQADLVINETGVSNRHLKLLRDQNNFSIQNLSEIDNSKLNGEPLETYKIYQLHNGDTIDLANQKFTIKFN